jgi:hypothetical protein
VHLHYDRLQHFEHWRELRRYENGRKDAALRDFQVERSEGCFGVEASLRLSEIHGDYADR